MWMDDGGHHKNNKKISTGIIGSDFPKNPTRIGRFYFLTVMNKCRIIHVFQKSKLKSCDKSH
jgi:hypothetical protein